MEFGEKLETVQDGAFGCCTSLRGITAPSLRTIRYGAFYGCSGAADAELGEGLDEIDLRVHFLMIAAL